MIIINLFGRPGCHLCDDVRDVLVSVQPKYNFELQEFNILDDEELFNKYVVDIPVVTINNTYFCQYRIRLEQLEQKLDSLIEEKTNES